ncbi:nuclear cap-binding protein subunit 2 [Platysternon megacephalum]|uniref:Nuclear cap-binding protein subunit 2 n=1 Tax=Platysternon megacephalum TaxID=55544 RepID=A0A4D9DXQ7_9SAUR|nr:nuclear cap-binding protein subunit 2 [Platysternon megacephalum]
MLPDGTGDLVEGGAGGNGSMVKEPTDYQTQASAMCCSWAAACRGLEGRPGVLVLPNFKPTGAFAEPNVPFEHNHDWVSHSPGKGGGEERGERKHSREGARWEPSPERVVMEKAERKTGKDPRPNSLLSCPA